MYYAGDINVILYMQYSLVFYGFQQSIVIPFLFLSWLKQT